jgi:hypothetical protein
MVKPSPTILIGGATAAATAIGACLLARRGSAGRRIGCVVGLGGVAAAAVAWFAADRQDREITRNPDTMNAHFLTAGESSAMTGNLAELPELRQLVGSRALAVVGRRKGRGAHAHRLR